MDKSLKPIPNYEWNVVYEIKKDVIDLINLIKSYGYKVGISIKPKTKVEELNKKFDNNSIGINIFLLVVKS